MRRFLAHFAFCLFLPAAWCETILVVPFANKTQDASLDWIGESISESIREAVQASGQPTVRREERAEAVKRLSLRPNAPLSFASVIKLGENLDAGIIIHGSFELSVTESKESRGSLRVAAKIFRRQGVHHSGEYVESGPLEDLSSVQNHVAWQVLQAVPAPLPITRQEFDHRHPSIRVTALENYIRGLLAQTEEQRHRYFAQAARLDPNFPQPCFYLGRMQWEEENYPVAVGWLEKVRKESIFYDEATYLLGLSRFHLSDFDGARGAFAELAERLPAAEVFNNLGAAQLELDQPEALANFRKALEKDGADPDYHFNVGYALWKKGDFETAATIFRAVLDRSRDDQDAILLLGRCLKQSGPRPGDLRTEGLERLKEEFSGAAGRNPKALASSPLIK